MSDTSVDLSNALTFRQQWTSGRRWVHAAWTIFTQNPKLWLALALLSGLASLLGSFQFGFVVQALAQVVSTSLFVLAAVQWQQTATCSWSQLKAAWLARSVSILNLAVIALLLTLVGNVLVNLALNDVVSFQVPAPTHLGLAGMCLLLVIALIHAAIFSFSPAQIALNQHDAGAAIRSSITTFLANLPAILGAFFSMLFWIVLYVLLGLMVGWMLLKVSDALIPGANAMLQQLLQMLFTLPVIAIAGLLAYTSWEALFGWQPEQGMTTPE